MTFFKKRLYFAIALLGLIFLGTGYFMLQDGTKTHFVGEMKESQNTPQNVKFENASKTILLEHKERRQACVITSETSLFKRDPLSEEMKVVHALFQEGFDDEGQKLLEILAKEALYSYEDKKLFAKDVLLKRYQISGFELPRGKIDAEPLLTGEAGVAIYEPEKSSLILYGTSEKKVILKQEKNSFQIASLRMDLSFSEGGIEDVTVSQDVEIKTESGERFFSDKAIFSKPQANGKFTFFELLSLSDEGLCLVKTTQGADLRSKAITIDETSSLINLRPPVTVQYEDSIIKADSDVSINRKEGAEIIFSSGPSTITFIDELLQPHVLDVYGAIELDLVKQVVAMERGDEKQIYFHDALGDIYADFATLVYKKQGKTIVPLSLFANGSCKLIYKKSGAIAYALSDSLEYNFQNKELKLSATLPNRVLFFDQSNQMEASAPLLKIKRDGDLKTRIEAEGDVRFLFKDHELLDLKKKFSLDRR